MSDRILDHNNKSSSVAIPMTVTTVNVVRENNSNNSHNSTISHSHNHNFIQRNHLNNAMDDIASSPPCIVTMNHHHNNNTTLTHKKTGGPMAVTSGPIVRDGERPTRRSTNPCQVPQKQALVDPRTGQAMNVARTHLQQIQPKGFRTVTDDSESPRRETHRRSSSWDGMGRKLSPSRSPSPSVESPRLSQLTDEQLFQYITTRTRNSPSPGRHIKYTRSHSKLSPTLKPQSPHQRDQSQPQSQQPHVATSNSPRTSAAKKQLERQIDEFCDELAEIHQFEDSITRKISELQLSAEHDKNVRDGSKPGDVKHIATPPQERFKSPKHNIEIAVPPANVVRPTHSRNVTYPFKATESPIVVPAIVDFERSAFFPAQRRSFSKK